MTNVFACKSIFLPWPASVLGGNPDAIAGALTAAGFEGVLVHSPYVWTLPNVLTPALVYSLRKAGLAVAGSAAIYGYFPTEEGQQAGELVTRLGLDGFVFDAETDFDKQPNANSNAVKVLRGFRERAGLTKAAWCSWAFPSYHIPDIVRAAMEFADVGMPMAYWNPGTTADAAARYLRSSLAEWDRWCSKPICPAGRAYNGDNGTASAEGIAGFAAEVCAQGLPGLTWWDMYHAVKLPQIWQALAKTPGMKQPEVDESKLTNKVFLPQVNR